MTTKIEISSAAFSYGDKEVWKDINLNVKEGEIICIIGPNGCGKTTFLNCIHGNLSLKNGSIKIDGTDIKIMSSIEIAHKVGYVFQEHNAAFPYTCLEVVKMGRAPHLKLFQAPSEEDTRLAKNIMKEMGIEHLSRKPYTHISGGERQLVLIARTLCQGSGTILFDEPTSHLDLKNQAVILNTIRNLSEKGLTIIMTSHFPNHVWQLECRVVMMGYDGIIAVGKVEDVMTDENLSTAYGVKVKIYEGKSDKDIINFCNVELYSS